MVFGFGSSSTAASTRQTKLHLEPMQIREMPDPTTPAFDEWVDSMFKDGQELIESMGEWHKHSTHHHGTVQCLTLPTSSSGPQAATRARLGIKDFWCGRESFHTPKELAELQAKVAPTAVGAAPSGTHPALPNRRSSFGLSLLLKKREEEESQHVMVHGHDSGSQSDAARALKMMSESPECVYERFRRGLLQYHSQNERDYIESCREAEQLEVFRKHTAEVWRLTYVTPPPTNPRTFVILLLSREITHSPIGQRQFMNISIPFLHPACPPKEGAEKSRVRGRYVSVERVTEMDGGKKVQWRMCTSSDAGGNIPRSMTNYSLPGKIAEDVPSFLEWMIKLFPEGSELDSGNAQANGLFAAYQPQANAASTTISAPGKVLVAGGYLVLDPSYSGVVIATSSRFYTTISTTKPNANKQSSIKVSSPQFQAATWEYSFNTSSTKSFVTPVSGGTNKFVELALDKTLKLIKAIKRSRGDSAVELERSLDIVIVGDNDFYSQRQQLDKLSLPPTLASLSSLAPFNSTHSTLGDVHKTGLGSSAALITSLVAGLLVHFGVVDAAHVSSNTLSTTKESTNDLALIHNTSQFIHCLAQGKVGSGFDVSSAVYGSQVYRRFGPEIIENVMSDNAIEEDEAELLLNTLRPSDRWTNKVSPMELPPLFGLLLADVDAGSDTPSLVGKVLKWRKENVEAADELYTSLAHQNDRFAVLLRRLSTAAESDRQRYNRTMEVLSRETITTVVSPLEKQGVDEDLINDVREVSKVMANIRVLMKRMGTEAGVPIEPDEQSRLLDTCVDVEGVVGGGVPGAGGYDALFLLIIEPPSSPSAAISKIESIWGQWKELSVCPLSCSADRGGLRLENVDEVRGFKQAVERGRSRAV